VLGLLVRDDEELKKRVADRKLKNDPVLLDANAIQEGMVSLHVLVLISFVSVMLCRCRLIDGRG
jgi:hypothetical protein